MGLSISWIGFQGIDKAEVLRRVALHDTGIENQANEAPFSIAELPNGWTILFAKNVNYVTAERLAELSRSAMLVACQVEEHAMISAAHCFSDGHQVWSVSHSSDRGAYDLEARGALPESFEAIKTRVFARQNVAEGVEIRNASAPDINPILERLRSLNPNTRVSTEFTMHVDYVFDIPIELAAELAGYRHDCAKFDWGKPRFIGLEPGSHPEPVKG